MGEDLIPSGGHAFPSQNYATYGMTLRDYFAAKAMAEVSWAEVSWDGRRNDDCATVCYAIADSMLKARQL